MEKPKEVQHSSATDIAKDTQANTTKGAWVKMFQENRNTEKGQALRDGLRTNGDVQMDSSELSPPTHSWGHCAVGYFLDVIGLKISISWQKK